MKNPVPKLQIGPVELGAIPRIIAVLDAILTDAELKSLFDQGATLAEIRFDLLPGNFEAKLAYVQTVRRAASFGVLGTLRETPENRENRLERFKALLPVVDAVDIEIDAAIAPGVIELAQGKPVIISQHDFKKTPTEGELFSMADTAIKLGATLFKIAALATTQEESARLLGFIQKCPVPIIAIVMGKLGRKARVEALRLGSLAGYAYTGKKPVAPGQLSVAQMARALATPKA